MIQSWSVNMTNFVPHFALQEAAFGAESGKSCFSGGTQAVHSGFFLAAVQRTSNCGRKSSKTTTHSCSACKAQADQVQDHKIGNPRGKPGVICHRMSHQCCALNFTSTALNLHESSTSCLEIFRRALPLHESFFLLF